MADVPNDADISSIKPSQMVLAGESDASVVPAVLKQLAAINYDGSISVLTNSGMLGGRSKNSVVGGIAKQLNNLLIVAGLIEGEIEEEATAAPEGEEGDATPEVAGEAKDKKDEEKKPEPAKA